MHADGQFVYVTNQGENNEVDFMSYFVIQKYETDLINFLHRKKTQSSTVLEIVYQLIGAFELIHKCGYTYNDLKLENVMISKGEQGRIKVNLIDFGFA